MNLSFSVIPLYLSFFLFLPHDYIIYFLIFVLHYVDMYFIDVPEEHVIFCFLYWQIYILLLLLSYKGGHSIEAGYNYNYDYYYQVIILLKLSSLFKKKIIPN
jgi:hypothetical protein